MSFSNRTLSPHSMWTVKLSSKAIERHGGWFFSLVALHGPVGGGIFLAALSDMEYCPLWSLFTVHTDEKRKNETADGCAYVVHAVHRVFRVPQKKAVVIRLWAFCARQRLKGGKIPSVLLINV
jgi:hypothetical protein